jgi:hypothetical protein
VAAYAIWQARIGEWFGIAELAWTSVEPEYDPFKYNSLAVNAGVQAYRITEMVQEQLTRLSDENRLGEVPPVLRLPVSGRRHGDGHCGEAEFVRQAAAGQR